MSAYYRTSSQPVFRSPSSPAGVFIDSRSQPPSYSSSDLVPVTSLTFINVKGSSSLSVTETREAVKRISHRKKRTCMCSPSTHPGSFRCSLHKNSTVAYAPNRHNAQRSAMTNSKVRIRGTERELLKRALAALIRQPSYNQRRRCDFRPRPSRFSVMSKFEQVS